MNEELLRDPSFFHAAANKLNIIEVAPRCARDVDEFFFYAHDARVICFASSQLHQLNFAATFNNRAICEKNPYFHPGLHGNER